MTAVSYEPKSAGNKKRPIHPAYLLTGLNRSDSTPPRPPGAHPGNIFTHHPSTKLMGYHAERTVVTYDGHGHASTVAKYHASLSVAKRMDWLPGVTHSKTVAGMRYVFHDGCTDGKPCSTSRLVSR